MNAMLTPTRCCAFVFGLLAVSTLPVLAGVNRWTSSGSVAGVRVVAIDPMDPSVVYAGTQKGVFKTSNGGLSWSDPSDGALDGVEVHCLRFDPSRPSNLYAGTADGLIESTDGGVRWSIRLAAHAIYNIVFGSQHTAYAAARDDIEDSKPSTLYKSSDDGKTWTASTLPFVIMPGTFVVDPTQPLTLYAGGTEPGFVAFVGEEPYSNVKKSVDGGVTWSDLPVDAGPLVFDPQNPSTIYLGSTGGVYKTVDSGSTWSFLRSPDLTGIAVMALAIVPWNPTTLYAGTLWGGVFRSTDGGASWSRFGAGLGDFKIINLVIDSTGTRLHAVNQGTYIDHHEGTVSDYQIFSGALDLAVGSDNTSHLLFTDTDSHLTFRSVDSAGNSTSAGPYGPYSGWFPSAVANGSDGLTRVLWSNPDGSAALWLYGASGNQASFRLGPVQGWTAVDVAAGTPGTTHILWTHEDGRVGFWAVDNSGQISYGPKLPADPGWTAIAIAGGADGLTWLLWNKVDGSAGLSLVGRIRTRAVLSNLPSTPPFRILPVPPPEGLLATYRYGGSAGWRAVDVVVGADGQARILWTHADGRMALWRVDDSGNVTTRGPVYDAPAGFTAQRVGAGPDGLTQVLWNDLNGSALLWQMSSDNVYQQSFTVGPN